MTAGNTVWLASYPKSGNTWVRAIVTALGTDPQLFGVDRLSSGMQPHHLGMALAAFGLDPRWLSVEENDVLRATLSQLISDAVDGAPVLRKTHEVYRSGAAGREPFPTAATRAGILVVRDPRDVACSAAAFFGVSLDEAIAAMGREGGEPEANPARAQTAQPWGTWSTHAESWLAPDLPFEVEIVRYEDLHADAVATLLPVLRAVGLTCTESDLADAVERTRFEHLQASEAERGFRGTHPRTERFFRRGVEGGWRDELSKAQVARIESDHGTVMDRIGYLRAHPSSDDSWAEHPAGLGLRVREGTVPAELPGAERPRPWIQVTSDAALLHFRGRAGLLVEAGVDVVVDRAESDEVGWIVQGWAVTVAMLQRGLLSLHASTVDVGGRVLAIAGSRGAGKSTTAMGLRGRGHALLCDDVTVIEFRDGGAWTTPYWRNVHLLEDSASALGVDFAELAPLGRGRSKAAFRPEVPSDRPRRIDGIIVLSSAGADAAVTTSRPTGSARMAALVEHTARDGIAPLLLGPERYFAQVAQLADLVPITIVERPGSAWSLDAVLDAIEGLA